MTNGSLRVLSGTCAEENEDDDDAFMMWLSHRRARGILLRGAAFGIGLKKQVHIVDPFSPVWKGLTSLVFCDMIALSGLAPAIQFERRPTVKQLALQKHTFALTG